MTEYLLDLEVLCCLHIENFKTAKSLTDSGIIGTYLISVFWNVLHDICLLKCVQEPTNGSGFLSLPWGIPTIINQIRFKENCDSNKSFDSSSIKSVNDGGLFSFPME